MAKRKKYKDNTKYNPFETGIYSISFLHDKNKWQIYINKNGKEIYELHDSYEEATKWLSIYRWRKRINYIDNVEGSVEETNPAKIKKMKDRDNRLRDIFGK